MEIKNILVPVDLPAPSSYFTIDIAAQIAQKTKATVKLLYVADVPYEVKKKNSPSSLSGSIGGDVGSYEGSPKGQDSDDFRVYMSEKTEKAYDDIIEKYPDVTFESHVKVDYYQKHLYTFIKNEKYDLVVIKYNEESNPEQKITSEVIRYSPSPVLTVYEPIEKFNPKNIVFASDFKDVPTQTLDYLKGIQANYDSEMHLLKVETPGFFSGSKNSLKVMDEFIEKHKLSNTYKDIYNAEEVPEGIIEFSEQSGSDLIVLTTEGRRGISHWIFGSYAEYVAIVAKTPVLTFNEHYSA